MAQAHSSYFNSEVPDIVLKSIFTKYDKDGSGCLSSTEMQEMFVTDLGMNADQAETFRYILDKDGDQKLSFGEFNRWMRSGDRFKNIEDKSRFFIIKKAIELFKTYDADGSGALDKREFRKLMIDLGAKPKNVKKAFKELDEDGDGVFSFPEFLAFLQWMPIE